MTIKTEIPFKRPSLPVLEGLQVLRGIAAILIAMKHAFYEVEIMRDWGGFTMPDYPFTVGIDIFFVLSGFVMVYTSQGKIGKPGYPLEFFKRRLVRIVPIYWFYTFLLAGVALVMPQVLGTAVFNVPHFLESLFFVPHVNPGDGSMQPFLANGWTLNYEVYFYLVFALLLFFSPKYLITLLSLYFIGTVFLGAYFSPESQTLMGVYTHFMVLDFLAGCWIAFFFVKGGRLPAMIKKPAYLLVFFIFILPFLLNMLSIEYPPYFKMMMAIAIVALLTLPSGIETDKSPRSLKAVGDSSYTLYLFHPFALGVVTQIFLFFQWHQSVPAWSIFLLCILTSVVGAIFLYVLVEKPLLQLGKNHILNSKQKKNVKVTA